MAKWLVRYDYDGGSGEELVEAETQEDATLLAMTRATPTWASDPETPCRLTGAMRLLEYAELEALPAAGVRVAVDLTWDRRDTGRQYLVLERGSLWRDLRHWWTDTARIVGTAATLRGARRIATAARRARGAGRYDIVRRSEVQVRLSGTAYGCLAGEEAA